MRVPMRALAGALLILLTVRCFADVPSGVLARGVVTGAGERPVAGARVAAPGGGEVSTDEDGRFEIGVRGEAPVALRVEASGYAPRTFAWSGEAEMRIRLTPSSFAEAVTVTAERAPSRVRDVPSSVVAISSDGLELAPTTAVDATLRQVPGFTLFRRSDSRTANPTTQGVSLRGVGGSGASRALVLDDGVPLNDPFGGWVAWGRIVQPSLDRVEVLRGGSSDRYGASALSGVIQVVRREPADAALAAEASYGSADSAAADVFASAAAGPWSARVAASGYRTDGFVVVAPDQAGPIDVPARSEYATAEAAVARSTNSGGRLFVRGSYFAEDRGNGTPLQVNDTRLWQVSAGGEGTIASGAWTARAYGLGETYHQTFTAVSPERTEETLTRRQEVPSAAAGASAQWETARGAHRLLAGIEGRYVSGASNELVGPNGSSIADAGGRQAIGSVYLQDRIAAGERWTVSLSLRFDSWSNFDGYRATGPAGETPLETPLENRSARSWSPRVAAAFRASSDFSLSASAYRAYRPPTLNELYRNFRVGNSLTLANEELGPETLVGGEIGGVWSAPSGAASLRATLFWAEIDGAIGNRTQEVTPSLITRQRRNLGLTRARGLEVDVEASLGAFVRIAGGYLYADSRVVESEEPSLPGKRVPQVPRHQATLQILGTFDRARVAVLGRYGAFQWEDDLNTLRLPGFTALDAQAAYALSPALEIFLAAENLTNRRVVTGRTPLATLGPPRQLRGGVRFRLG
jgi:outer membrane receptor protein involved in Fe transport